MISRGLRHAASRVLVLVALAALTACDKVPLTAPTESTITLFARGSSVPANGSVDIIATVTESAGTPVQNGTVVTFTTTLGTISPAEARTNGGKVTVKLTSDGRSGTASVVAFSGSAQSEALEIPVGAGATESVVVSANPSTVPAGGGSVQIVAQVRDQAGNGIASVPVSFSSTAGTLSRTSVNSDSTGQATTTLTTTRNATVTARAGAQEATVDVAVTTAPTVAVTATPASPIVGQPAVFTITVTPAADGAPIESMTIDFGDGASQTLGNSSTSVSHVYAAHGTYTVTVRVRDTAGQETTQVIVIVVVAPTPTEGPPAQ